MVSTVDAEASTVLFSRNLQKGGSLLSNWR